MRKNTSTETTVTATRYCKQCKAPLVRHPEEWIGHWEARRHCSKDCSFASVKQFRQLKVAAFRAPRACGCGGAPEAEHESGCIQKAHPLGSTRHVLTLGECEVVGYRRSQNNRFVLLRYFDATTLRERTRLVGASLLCDQREPGVPDYARYRMKPLRAK